MKNITEPKRITIQKVVAQAKMGCDAMSCCQEAALLALECNEIVELNHNDEVYTANPALLAGQVFASHKPKPPGLT